MMRRRPSLEALRIFEACARLGGFTRAANEIGLSQSAVSLRMRDLQADLGVPLFARTRPRLVLTAEGERLARGVADGLREISQAVDVVRSESPPLRLSVNPTFAARWLAPRLASFTAREGAPEINIEATTEIRPMLAAGGCDLAIRSGMGDWPGVVATPLMPVERTPMLSPALARRLGADPRPEDLKRLPLLRSPEWARWFAAAGASPAGARFAPETYPTQELLAEAAASGAGAALLSPTLFGARIAQGDLAAPFDVVLSGPDAHYVVHAPGPLPPGAAAFVEWLKGEARAHGADHVVARNAARGGV